VIPGLGQLADRHGRLAALFLIPSLILIAIGLVLIESQSPARLAAWVASPSVLGVVLTLNLLVLAWRLVAVGQAFLDTSRTGPTGRLGIVGLLVIAILVVIPHLAVYRYGTILGDTFGKIFTGATLGDERGVTGPGANERLNVLLIGVDATRTRTETLTDTMMVASLDPVGHTVSLVSIPRDLVSTPLGNGDVYAPKLNSLMSYADAHPKVFPNGGIQTLEDAVGALLGIHIDYYARLDFSGFIKMIDAVGGVDIDVPRGFDDPSYDGYGLGKVKGFSITAGPHHLDGADALAYARVRKALGESDFTRQARQQQILVALRAKMTQGGSLLFELPALLDAVGQTIRSDLPTDRLPALAAIMDEVGRKSVTSVVIRSPLVHPKATRFGDAQVPDLVRILAVAAGVFSEPGTAPSPWPTPKPTPSPKPTKAPKATATPGS